MQPHHRVQPVHVLRAVLLRFDDQLARFGDAGVMQRQKPLLHIIGQGRRPNVKPQMDRAGHLVHILPTRTLRPDSGDGDFRFVDLQHRAGLFAGVAARHLGRVLAIP